ncbi:MAG: GntR family transcriptional regulator, partial [Lacrimispora sp.]
MKNDARQTGETAKEYAYRILKENIITLEPEPGSTLNDMEISQMIGISRTPVR